MSLSTLNFNVNHAGEGLLNHGTIIFEATSTTAGSCYIHTNGHGVQPKVNGLDSSWQYMVQTVDSGLEFSCDLNPPLTLTVHGQPERQDESYTGMAATVTMDNDGNITSATNGSITYPTPASDGTDSWTASATTGQGAACEAGA